MASNFTNNKLIPFSNYATSQKCQQILIKIIITSFTCKKHKYDILVYSYVTEIKEMTLKGL